jgi:hypothetical protein
VAALTLDGLERLRDLAEAADAPVPSSSVARWPAPRARIRLGEQERVCNTSSVETADQE